MAIEQEAVARPRRRPGVDAEHEHYKWWALSCTSLGMLLATINSGTLIIALPDLEDALHTSILSLVWVILAYMISSTVLVLFAGRLSDLFGRKQAYVLGFVLFGLASLGAGFSANGTELILLRSCSPTPARSSRTRSRRSSSGSPWGRTRWWPPSGL
jgi:MFS family permease